MIWVGCRPNRSLDPLQRHRASKSSFDGLLIAKVGLALSAAQRLRYSKVDTFAKI